METALPEVVTLRGPGHSMLSRTLSFVWSVLGEQASSPTSLQKVPPPGTSRTPKSGSKEAAPVRCHMGSCSQGTSGRIGNTAWCSPASHSAAKSSVESVGAAVTAHKQQKFGQTRIVMRIDIQTSRFWKDVMMGKRKMNCSLELVTGWSEQEGG